MCSVLDIHLCYFFSVFMFDRIGMLPHKLVLVVYVEAVSVHMANVCASVFYAHGQDVGQRPLKH